MKKRIILFGTILGFVLALSILGVGVYAAMSHQLGITNSIHFSGKSEYIKFTLDAEITGTDNDGASYLSKNWEYDYSDVTKNNSLDWNIEETLSFAKREGNSGSECITYTFTISNNSEGGVPIKVSIVPPNLDTGALKYEIPQNDITIAQGTTGTITLKLMPASTGGYTGTRECSFTINLDEA